MEKSLLDVGGEMLIVSQFTLAASTRKGNRPSFSNAEKPARAKCLYEQFVAAVKRLGIQVATGKFAADMDVALTNDGPVTLLLSDAG